MAQKPYPHRTASLTARSPSRSVRSSPTHCTLAKMTLIAPSPDVPDDTEVLIAIPLCNGSAPGRLPNRRGNPQRLRQRVAHAPADQSHQRRLPAEDVGRGTEPGSDGAREVARQLRGPCPATSPRPGEPRSPGLQPTRRRTGALATMATLPPEPIGRIDPSQPAWNGRAVRASTYRFRLASTTPRSTAASRRKTLAHGLAAPDRGRFP